MEMNTLDFNEKKDGFINIAKFMNTKFNGLLEKLNQEKMNTLQEIRIRAETKALYFFIFVFNNSQFSFKHFGKKIPIAAGRLEKTTVYALGLLFYKVAHSLDLTLSGKYLAVFGYPLL